MQKTTHRIVLICAGLVILLAPGHPLRAEATPTSVEQVLQDFTTRNVLPTYKTMADEAVLLAAACEKLKENTSDEELAKAAALWRSTRSAWEKGEAFLFGPAAFNNLDPLLDSWPLDQRQIDEIIKLKGSDIDAAYISGNLGSGVRGFHAAEYLLFIDGRPRTAKEITPAEVAYLAAVSEVLRNDCVTLEAWWAGAGNIGEKKANILEEAEIDVPGSYADEMTGAGKPGSRYASQKDALVEIIQGCFDIAAESGKAKIGEPVASGNPLEVESWFSWDSLIDVENNLRGIEAVYLGGPEGNRGKGLTVIVAQADPELDRAIRAQLKDAVEKVRAVKVPLRNNLKDPSTQPAIEACNKLSESLEAALAKLG